MLPVHASTDVVTVIRRAAAAYPARIAISWEDGARTYSELISRIDALAASLAARGLGTGQPVALLMRNGPGFVEAYLATLQLGAIAVPYNLRLAPDEVAYRLSDAKPTMFLTDPEGLELARRSEIPTGCLRLTEGSDWEDAERIESLISEGQDLPRVRPDIPLSAPASILYTSGTTGHPKGVVRTQFALAMIIALRQAAMFISPDTVLLATTPMFHPAGHEFMLLQTLAAGGRIVSRRVFDSAEIVNLVPREAITHAFFVPTMGMHLLDALEGKETDWPSLKLWCSAAAPLPAALRERILTRLPHTALWNVYGVTEAGVVTYLRDVDIERKSGTCVGLPYTAMEVRCVDPGGVVVPTGEVGEVVCRSPEAMVGYWGNPDATAAATRGGWVWSGDLGMFDEEGFLYIVDRVKDMVISGGENVYAAEVENALASFPGIADVAVIGVPHPVWGEAVVAVVAGLPGTTIDEQALIQHTCTAIARYKAPKRVLVVDALERNSYGKVIKDTLRARYAELFVG